MSTADNWDFTIPDDPAELAAELRRHGLGPGRRITLYAHPEAEPAPLNGPKAEAPRRRFRFIGSFEGPPDLSGPNTDKCLKGCGE